MKNWTRASTTLKEHAIFRTHVESVNDTAMTVSDTAVTQPVAVQIDKL